MGARSGGGGGQRSAYTGYLSGLGTNKGYGLTNDQRYVFEALKSNAKAYYGYSEFKSGAYGFDVNGKTYSEEGLAKAVKQGWNNAMKLYGLTSKQLADKHVKYLINHKTGDFFGL